MFDVNTQYGKLMHSIVAPLATLPVEPVINRRYWAQLRTGKPMFATDVIVVRADGESVDFCDVLGGWVFRYPKADVMFYEWTPDIIL